MRKEGGFLYRPTYEADTEKTREGKAISEGGSCAIVIIIGKEIHLVANMGFSIRLQRKIKVVTEQHNINKPAAQEGYPMKEWSVELYILDQDGKERPARCFTKVTYNLHPSFEKPVQSK